MKLLVAMHDAKAALYAGLGRETFASLAGDFEKRGFLDRTIGLPYGLRVVVCGCGTTTHMRRRKIGQEAGIRTRTVRFTGGDAALTPQSWKMVPPRGLAPRASSFAERHAHSLTPWGPWHP